MGSARLAEIGAAGSDLAALDNRVQADTTKAGLAARAQVLATAARAVAGSDLVGSGEPLVLLDVPIGSPLEADVIAALLARATASLVTLPAEDSRRTTRWSRSAWPSSLSPTIGRPQR